MAKSGAIQAKVTDEKPKQNPKDMQEVYETIWKSIFLFMAIFAAVLLNNIRLFQNSEYTQTIQKGSIWDFKWSILVAFAVWGIRKAIKILMFDRMLSIIDETRFQTIESRRSRANTLCKWLFDIVYYTCSTIAVYLILKDHNFLPWTLFGTGDSRNIFQGWPRMPQVVYLREFYIVQAGVHLYAFTHQVCSKYGDPKYFEQLLHHGLALFLIFFSQMMNFWLIGALVLYIHDPGDVVLIIARSLSDIKNKNKLAKNISYVICFSTWIWTRIINFPMVIISASLWHFNMPAEQFRDILTLPGHFMRWMMMCLFIMHCFWTYFLAKAFVTNFVSKRSRNTYD